MIEVFKTNVHNLQDAQRLVGLIHASFPGYKANFDLQDCDKVLRVVTENGMIHCCALISLLNGMGFDAEILPDIVPVAKTAILVNAAGQMQISGLYLQV